MWKTRKGDSEQSLQDEPQLGRSRNACDRNDSNLQTDWQEEKRVIGRYKKIGKKEYSKSFDDLEARLSFSRGSVRFPLRFGSTYR